MVHCLCTTSGPCSSHCSFVIHICWKVESDARIEPPIHAECLRSGGAMTFRGMVDGANACNSFCNRSAIPRKTDEPPEMTTFEYKSLRMSTSHLEIASKAMSYIPRPSRPMMLGANRPSGTRKRSLPTLIIWPSSNSYVFSRVLLSMLISASRSKAT